ncbi:hypothetical protein AB0N62_41740 [Streptomyces sp. NPDC093982]|uniref:hypothetical protein n=1 Tax=Streptomyces sp. NPDC093982 TaxID=3155077 RepID=UPI00343AED48
MELRIHRASGICFPTLNPSKWAGAIGGSCTRTKNRLTDAIGRHATGVRLGAYSAIGTATGAAAAAVGMDPRDAISLGMNVAATAAAFWPPYSARMGVIGSEAL